MSQATTTNRGPRGWDRLVAQLNAAPDLSTFHRGMLDLQCKIVAAEYGALWVLDESNPKALELWPETAQQLPPNAPLMQILISAAKAGFDRQVSHVLKLEAETTDPNNSELGAHVFVTVLRNKGKVTALTTVVAECRDAQVLQSTQPLRELAAGLYEGFFSRQEAVQRDHDAQRIRQALALLAVSQEAEGFGGSALNLVNELARQLSCMRVSLGWIRGNGIRLVAMSDTEQLKRQSEEVATIELAMAECLDQQQPIAYPIPPGAEPLLLHAVVHAHKKLVREASQYTVSLPLRHRDEWIGVLTLERLGQPFEPGTIQYLQLIADVVSPHMDDRHHSDRFLVGHAWHSTEKAAAYLVGPRHVAWKMGAIVLIFALAYTIFGTWHYRISAPVVVEARQRQFLPALFEGQIAKVRVQPGDKVKQGDVLAELDTAERRLQLRQSIEKRELAKLDWAKKKSEGKENEAQQKLAEARAADANVKLLEHHIALATLRAPADGVVLSGYWVDKVGSSVRQGDEMFEVAPLSDLIALIHVGENDISEIKTDPDARMTGEFATKSLPEQSFKFHTILVVPSAQPVNGVNSFDVRAEIEDPAEWLRPGMEGLAKVDIGRKPLWWIFTHRLVDTLRLWLWW